MDIVQCRHVSKRYKTFELSDINLSIPRGQVIGLVGENGAGKTTLINLLLNKAKRDTGEILVFGKDLLSNEIDIKQKLGVVLDDSFLPMEFNICEIQGFMKLIYKNWNSQVYNQYIDVFELPLNQKTGSFSKGMKRKLDLAIALSHEAELLIFDEVTNGLDVVAQKMIIDILKDLMSGKNITILLSTHNVVEIKGIVDQVILLSGGKISSFEDKKSLMENYVIADIDEHKFTDIKSRYCIERSTQEAGKVRLLLDKRRNDLNCDDPLYRHAELEEVIYMKIKGE